MKVGAIFKGIGVGTVLTIVGGAAMGAADAAVVAIRDVARGEAGIREAAKRVAKAGAKRAVVGTAGCVGAAVGAAAGGTVAGGVAPGVAQFAGGLGGYWAGSRLAEKLVG